MTLKQVIADLDKIDSSLTICAGRSPAWTSASAVDLVPAHQAPGALKLPYFLEVAVAKDVLRAWSFARGGRMPSLAKKCEALIYYAENDAYILPKHERS